MSSTTVPLGHVPFSPGAAEALADWARSKTYDLGAGEADSADEARAIAAGYLHYAAIFDAAEAGHIDRETGLAIADEVARHEADLRADHENCKARVVDEHPDDAQEALEWIEFSGKRAGQLRELLGAIR